MATVKNVCEIEIVTSTGFKKEFYLLAEERITLANEIENIISSSSSAPLRYECVKGRINIIPKKILESSIITFTKSHSKTF